MTLALPEASALAVGDPGWATALPGTSRANTVRPPQTLSAAVPHEHVGNARTEG